MPRQGIDLLHCDRNVYMTDERPAVDMGTDSPNNRESERSVNVNEE